MSAHDSDGLTVGVIGLGSMGAAMAARLAQSWPVIGFDVSPDRLAECAGWITAATSPAEVAAQAAVVVVSVRDGAQLDQVVDAVEPALVPGSVLVVTSTVGAPAVQAAAARLATRGNHVIDAPVSGGPVRAGRGDLLILVGAGSGRGTPRAGGPVTDATPTTGGTPTAGGTPDPGLVRARPVLDALASTVVVAGPVGAGQDFKTVNQLLCGVHTAAAAEALALAHRLGLDLDQVIDVLGRGAAASFMFSDRGPRIADQLRGAPPALISRLDIIDKDMGIVSALTRTHHVATPVAAAAEQLYRLAMAHDWAAEDDSVVATLL
jgi:3-hydroxyisobutyrate dehydrogenase